MNIYTTIKKLPNWFAIVHVFLFLVVAVILCLQALIFILPVAPLFVYFIDCFLWQIKGYEIVEVNKQFMILKRKGKLFPQSLKIKLENIQSVFVQDYKDLMLSDLVITLWGRMSKFYGESGGRICVRYSEVSFDFGQGLIKTEAEKLVRDINQYLVDNGIVYVADKSSKIVNIINKIIRTINKL